MERMCSIACFPVPSRDPSLLLELLLLPRTECGSSWAAPCIDRVMQTERASEIDLQQASLVQSFNDRQSMVFIYFRHDPRRSPSRWSRLIRVPLGCLTRQLSGCRGSDRRSQRGLSSLSPHDLVCCNCCKGRQSVCGTYTCIPSTAQRSDSTW